MLNSNKKVPRYYRKTVKHGDINFIFQTGTTLGFRVLVVSTLPHFKNGCDVTAHFMLHRFQTLALFTNAGNGVQHEVTSILDKVHVITSTEPV